MAKPYGGVAKLVYRAGLSRRRSRVRAPSLPKKLTALVVSFFYFISAFLFTGSSAGVARLVRDQEVGGSNPPCPISPKVEKARKFISSIAFEILSRLQIKTIVSIYSRRVAFFQYFLSFFSSYHKSLRGCTCSNGKKRTTATTEHRQPFRRKQATYSRLS